MTYTYRPRGVCSQLMEVEVEDGKIRRVQVLGGCDGNLQGISRRASAAAASPPPARISLPRP